jgi:hypothetical protein
VRRNLDVVRVVDDLDVLVIERREHVVHLVGTHVLARQRLVHVVVRQEPLALAEADELLFGALAVRLRRLCGVGSGGGSSVFARLAVGFRFRRGRGRALLRVADGRLLGGALRLLRWQKDLFRLRR